MPATRQNPLLKFITIRAIHTSRASPVFATANSPRLNWDEISGLRDAKEMLLELETLGPLMPSAADAGKAPPEQSSARQAWRLGLAGPPGASMHPCPHAGRNYG